MSKFYDVTSMQRLDQYLPYASWLMSVCLVAIELSKVVLVRRGHHSSPKAAGL